MTMQTTAENQTVKNQFIRIADLDMNASLILTRAQKSDDLPVEFARIGNQDASDYANVDLALTFSKSDEPATNVASGLGFAGWTPAQRWQFLSWLHETTDDCPSAFQSLYLASLEIRLFESELWRERVQTELQRLHNVPAWRDQPGLARVTGLAFWLRRDGDGLAAWLAESPTPPTWFGIALGWQALLGTPLRAGQMAALLQMWRLSPNLSVNQSVGSLLDVLALHLDSLANALGEDPLAHALAQIAPEALKPRPWRGVHRDVRLLLPQPDLSNILRPLLMEMKSNAFAPHPSRTEPIDQDGADSGPLKDNNEDNYTNWHLILEFRQSRSEYFPIALELAQRNNTFTQIMDEDRRLVYRVMFREGKLRNFWRLWEYVKGWSSTHVYVRGQEVGSWNIFPHSQSLY